MGKKAFRSTAGRMLSIFMILFLVMAVSAGCNSSSGGGSKDDTSENGGGTGDTGGTGGNGGTGGSDDTGGNGGSGDTGGSDDDPNCKVVLLEDDFSGSLTTNWTRGTNTLTNPGGPTVAIDNQEVLFSQNYDYIETKQSFSGNFQVQANLKRSAGAGSTQCASYYVELVGLDGVSAIMRFRYGSDAKESINIGKPPVSGQSRAHDCIRDDASYLEEIDHVGDLEGLLTLTYNNGTVQVSWTNSEGTTITTMAMSTGTFASSRVRIWAFAGHRIEHVKICGPEGAGTGDSGGDSDCKVVLLEDDFSGSLTTNWTRGTNTLTNPGGPTVAIDNQEVLFSQNYDYIETKQSFSGNFKVQASLKRNAGAGSTQCASYYVELVGLDSVSAIMRFRYGLDAMESINIGKPPVSGQSRAHDCIRDDASYLEEIDHVGDLEGLLTLTYNNGTVQVSWTNSEGTTITTMAMSTGTFASSRVRIWAFAGHRIEHVKICGLDDDASAGNGDTGSGGGDDDTGSGGGDDSNSVAEGIMPLSIGNWWLYSLESGGVVPGTYRMDAVRTQSVSGVTATRIEYSGDPMYDGYWSLLNNQDNALYFYGDSLNGTLTTPDLWFKSSLKIGDTWQTSGQGGVVDWVVISTSENVTVPAGTFDCILVRGVGEAGSHADHWWAVGIGEVKYEMDIDVAVIRGELKDYSVK